VLVRWLSAGALQDTQESICALDLVKTHGKQGSEWLQSRCAAAVCEQLALQRLTVWYHTTLPRGTVALLTFQSQTVSCPHVPAQAGDRWLLLCAIAAAACGCIP
jgi:hypothetical protein